MKTSLARQLFAEMWANGIKTDDIIKTLRISRRTACYWRKALGLAGRRRAS
jgi:hypothetical protein